jgi:hypothetical protein
MASEENESIAKGLRWLADLVEKGDFADELSGAYVTLTSDGRQATFVQFGRDERASMRRAMDQMEIERLDATLFGMAFEDAAAASEAENSAQIKAIVSKVGADDGDAR